ncbi:AAA domain-containing protein [Pseudomonas syringae]|nr:AAA domain-containing protein [Pseudomonas syringae]MCF5068919.1 AAA domain-containing protein [Pseudomonas syringae]
MATLFSWIGNTDLKASTDEANGLGPIAHALTERAFNSVHLLCNYETERATQYLTWLRQRFGSITLQLHSVKLTSPTDFAAIYREAKAFIQSWQEANPKAKPTFHLSPGTPAMAAVWIMLANGKFQASLIETSRESGLKDVQFPFNLAAEFVADSFLASDTRLTRDKLAIEHPEFDFIVGNSVQLVRAKHRARKAALRSLPVMIEGESGTGKEMFARAIHRASPRASKPFIAINCGAIPPDLAESELFGHEKGAFTGATATRTGHFEQANGGTLFLDEIAELPKPIQVKLLRVLQEGEIVRVGSSKAVPIDVRIIAATHCNLIHAVAQGFFREDLFYRLAVATLYLPALREREGDLNLLIDYLWELVGEENRTTRGYDHKKISVSARKILLQHYWPGNVRELINTLRRISMWAENDTITAEDVSEALLVHPDPAETNTLGLPTLIGQGIDLKGLIEKIKDHYISEALSLSGGNKKRAAELLGIVHYQTLSNWMKD